MYDLGCKGGVDVSLCREAEEGGGFCKFCLKGGISLQFLCEYAGDVDVCAFVAYLFVRSSRRGRPLEHAKIFF